MLPALAVAFKIKNHARIPFTLCRKCFLCAEQILNTLLLISEPRQLGLRFSRLTNESFDLISTSNNSLARHRNQQVRQLADFFLSALWDAIKIYFCTHNVYQSALWSGCTFEWMEPQSIMIYSV